MSALACNLDKPLKRNTLSNSAMSLNSPNNRIKSTLRNGMHKSIDGETGEEDEDEDEEEEEGESIESTEVTTESDEELSSQTRESSELQSSMNGDDDDAAKVRPMKTLTMKKPEPEKRTVPVPQIRFSKLLNNTKK